MPGRCLEVEIGPAAPSITTEVSSGMEMPVVMNLVRVTPEPFLNKSENMMHIFIKDGIEAEDKVICCEAIVIYLRVIGWNPESK